MAVAGRNIQIRPALLTKAPAVATAQHFYRDLQNDLLTDNGSKINKIALIITYFQLFRLKLQIFARLGFRGNQSISKITADRQLGIFQTTAAANIYQRGK